MSPAKPLRREPPARVRRLLRQEVGFGCPYESDGESCGNPYLEWAHFDPPWAERHHHNPAGMIALCHHHHTIADAALTTDQWRRLKVRARVNAPEVRGRFAWKRESLLARIGGLNCLWTADFKGTMVVFRHWSQPVVWFTRDSEGYQLLNIRMLTISGEPRVRMNDNFWTRIGSPIDVVCPPSGRLLQIEYANGDLLKIEYRERSTPPSFFMGMTDFPMPSTTLDVHLSVGGTSIKFGPEPAMLGSRNFRNNWVANLPVAMQFDGPLI